MLTVAFTNIRQMIRLSWLAPELLSKEGMTSFATDVYSFGMVIWELVTGYAPFCSKDKIFTEAEIRTVIKKGEMLTHHVLPQDTPDWLVAIFKACLSVHADERPEMGGIVQVLCLAVDPNKYVKLYQNQQQTTRSPWLQQTLSLLPQPLNLTLAQSSDDGRRDSDSDQEAPEALNDTLEINVMSRRTAQSRSSASPFASSQSSSESPTHSISELVEEPMRLDNPTLLKLNDQKSSLNPRLRLSRSATQREGVIDPVLLRVDEKKKLGQGGFGAVYQGRYQGQDVAVKQLLIQDFSPKAQEEFERESQMMLQLHDPRVVHLYGVTNVKPYRMVLEFCELGSLDKYLQKKSIDEVSWSVRFHLSTGIASGLHYLHSYQPMIIHGDLKSLNVLLKGNPARPEPKLGDFGMARLKTETQSKSKETKNKGSEGLTVSWAAPELFSLKGKKTPASDMYAFGMVLWEITSHSYPYANCSDPTIIRMEVMNGERAEIPEGTPELFSEVMKSCWSQNAQDRASAEQVLVKLQTYESSLEEEEVEGTMQKNTPLNTDYLRQGSGPRLNQSASSSPSATTPVVSSATRPTQTFTCTFANGFSKPKCYAKRR